MIVTLTLNPAVDQTISVDCLRVGDINRFRKSYLDPAGKGINVSRMAHRLGWPTIAFGFLAGEIGLIVEKALDTEQVAHYFIQIPGQTRLNVTIMEQATGTATSLLGPGPKVNADSMTRLERLLQYWLQAGRVLVLAGSLPPGVPEDVYATYIRLARIHGVKTVLDADGEPLRRGVAEQPDLIKPNVAEAERLLGRPLPDFPAIVEGARELARRGIGIVVISVGAQGAVCVQGERVWRVVPPQVPRRSTVGSGDSMVAGLAVALARGDPIVEGLRLGTAAGAATAMTAGTALGRPEDIATLLPQVQIEEVS